MARHTAPATLVLVALLLSGCRPDTVALEYRPAEGATHRYRIVVQAETTTTIEGRLPRRTSSSFVLRASHRVMTADEIGATVEVVLRAEDQPEQRLLVRLDRAGQLTDVASVEGVAADRLGQVGLAEIFPAAAGAPPPTPLQPGQRWVVDEPVRLPGASPTRLRGTGRLDSLGIVRGRRVATVTTDLRLPVRGFTGGASQGGTGVLRGTQTTVSQTTYALADGVVESSTATTRSSLRVRLQPPEGIDTRPLDGTVTLRVRSSATRER